MKTVIKKPIFHYKVRIYNQLLNQSISIGTGKVNPIKSSYLQSIFTVKGIHQVVLRGGPLSISSSNPFLFIEKGNLYDFSSIESTNRYRFLFSIFFAKYK